MCLSKPNIPTPDPVQEVKQPDASTLTRGKRKSALSTGGTLLTSPSGIASGALTTGAPTLLGG